MQNANLLVEDSKQFQQQLLGASAQHEQSTQDSSEQENMLVPPQKRSDSELQTIGKFLKIKKVHSVSVFVYWCCTVCMLIECFVLFIKAVTPSGLEFPDEYEFLRSQEIVLFVVALLQLVVMSMGVAYRGQLA